MVKDKQINDYDYTIFLSAEKGSRGIPERHAQW